ncbi:MAG: DNA repair protein RadA [Bacteroidota bacterium]|jgi:DNA repair protein RadA/Sms
MAKKRIQFVCDNCGHTTTKWMGNCPSCGEWHTFREVEVEKNSSSTKHKAKLDGSTQVAAPQPLNDVTYEEEVRFHSRISELDRVLGGGFMPGAFILLGGDPGVGKSTLTLQIARSNPRLNILYCSGEESASQIKQRAERLDVHSPNLKIFTDTDLSNILDAARKERPDLLIVDSIQTVYRTELTSMPGSIQQIRECSGMLQQLAKKEGITTMIIGHVTKEGDLAGPRMLEHMVDTVLQFEGDKNYSFRLLRTLKNRFGPAQEVGVFEMAGDGLTDVTNPSQLFLSKHSKQVSGNAVACTIEGSRPLLVEVQALVTASNYGVPQRTASGYDHKRLSLLLAVLEKRGGYQFSGQDVYLNIAGGIKLQDPAGDLSVACALVSSLREDPVPRNTVMLGEIGLGAEIRAVSKMDQRLNEIHKMGFKRTIIPSVQQYKGKKHELEIDEAESLLEAIEKAL